MVPGSPAEEMGLARGDVVTRVNGREVNNVFEFRLLLGESIIQNRSPQAGGAERRRKGGALTLPLLNQALEEGQHLHGQHDFG